MVTLFLAGDVMTGRGIDQILPHPGEPEIYEDDIKFAPSYIMLAERANGPIPSPVPFEYVWGNALKELDRRQPDARIVNLETAVTAAGKPEPKGINYRMNPANLPALSAAKLDCCVIANNHILDWGELGLLDTLSAVGSAGILTAGAGHDLREASQPAIIQVGPPRRVLVFGLGSECSGTPPYWAAETHTPGLHFLPDFSIETAQALASEILPLKQLGDIIVLSIHWGSNWGYVIPEAHQAFARALIDEGACDILHGHSSHHARPMEVYKGRLILYGCGDFINDYEGISGHEEYRGDLVPMYLAEIDEEDGFLEKLTIVLFQMHRFRLRYASESDVLWFQKRMNDCNQHFGLRLIHTADASLSVAGRRHEHQRRKIR
ncbi:MAG: CapA family protein [Rhodomicrobium sp.]